MDIKTLLETEATDRVSVFGKRPEIVFTPKETSLFAVVGTSLTALRNWGAKQVSGIQDFNDGVNNRQFLASEIRDALRDIADIAKSMEVEGEVGEAELFRYPRYSTYESLILTAESFADRAEPMIAQFTERGLPATFVTDLRGKITAFRGATDDKHGGKADRSAGTAGMRYTAYLGVKAIRTLRPILRVHLKNDPGLLAAWKFASRVEQPPRKKKASAAPSEPAPAPES